MHDTKHRSKYSPKKEIKETEIQKHNTPKWRKKYLRGNLQAPDRSSGQQAPPLKQRNQI